MRKVISKKVIPGLLAVLLLVSSVSYAKEPSKNDVDGHWAEE